MSEDAPEQDPLDHAGLEQRALSFVKQGKLNQAEQLYLQLAASQSRNHIVYGNLSAIFLLKGRFRESESFSRQALKIKSDFPQAHHCLGNALRRQGKFNAAIASYNLALKIDPNFAQVYDNLGVALKAKGQLSDAIECYSKAIKLDPKLFSAHHNLGIAYKQDGRASAAIECYQRALKLKPNFPEACNNLGIAYKEKGQISASIESYKQALRYKPDYVHALNNLGIAYKDKGDLKAAFDCHQSVLKIDPANSNAFYQLGRIQRSQGDLSAAKDSLKDALRCNPRNTDAIYILSTDIDNNKEAIDLIDVSQAALKAKLSIREKAMVKFCLANCEHKLKNYALAQKYIASANKYKLSYMPSNLEGRLRQAEKSMNDADSIQKGGPNDGFGRIFIVGVPRCGSTLLETILATNPNIIELGETDALPRAIKQISDLDGRESPAGLSDVYLREIKKSAQDALLTVDKNLYNYQRVGHIIRGMPAAKIIHCRRNPLDNILSMLRSNLRRGNNFTSDPLDAAKFILSHQRLIDRFSSNHKNQIYTFNYDDFANSPESTIRPLIQWLGLPWSRTYLHPEKNQRIVNTASAIQVRKPINNLSVDGWKRYRDLLDPARIFLDANGYDGL